MKDYSRKHYTDYNYRDWMRASPSKAMWNSILSQNVGYGEFTLNKNQKSSLDASIALYLKQSEMKKPYMDRGFVQMEDDWEGPPGGFMPRDPHDIHFPDYPWNVGPPGIPGGGWAIFDLECNDCWCPGEERPFTCFGTHPIYALSISGEESGTYITIVGGLGTNEVQGTIFAAEGERGSVNFQGSMRTAGGIAGSSNDLVYECRDCDPCEFTTTMTAGSNPDTIDQDDSEIILVVDGLGPYTWSVTGGTGFSMNEAETAGVSNSLIASAASCGTAIITVTDFCGTEVTIQVRSTSVTSDWAGKSTNCELPGAATEGDGRTRIIGKSKQEQSWKSWGSCFNHINCGCDINCLLSPRPECITFDCIALSGAGWTGGNNCCERSQGTSGADCRFYNTSDPSFLYWEWECI